MNWTDGVQESGRARRLEVCVDEWNTQHGPKPSYCSGAQQGLAKCGRRWVECVWWRRGQPWMQHPVGLAHVSRYGNRGLGTAWRGVNGATRNVKRNENKAERKRVGREQTRGAPIFSHAMRPKSGFSHQFLAEWPNNESVPIGRRRRLMQLVPGNFPCGAWVHDKFDQQKSDRCILCRKALREEAGANFCEQKIPRETVGHISSAGCKEQKEVVTLAHNNVSRDLMFDIARHRKKTSAKDFTTLGTEKTLGSLWERELGKRVVQQYVQQGRPVGGCG